MKYRIRASTALHQSPTAQRSTAVVLPAQEEARARGKLTDEIPDSLINCASPVAYCVEVDGGGLAGAGGVRESNR